MASDRADPSLERSTSSARSETKTPIIHLYTRCVRNDIAAAFLMDAPLTSDDSGPDSIRAEFVVLLLFSSRCAFVSFFRRVCVCV